MRLVKFDIKLNLKLHWYLNIWLIYYIQTDRPHRSLKPHYIDADRFSILKDSFGDKKMISVFCSSQDTAYEIRHGKPNIGDVFFHLELEYTFKAMCGDNRNNIYFKRKGNKNYVEIINGCAIT